MIPEKLLQALRQNANYYHLPNTVNVKRNEPDVDAYGGTSNDWRTIATIKGRVINKQITEEQIGGGIISKNEWTFILPEDADVMASDRLYIQNDENTDRYFEVVGTDRGASDGLFLSAKCEERAN